MSEATIPTCDGRENCATAVSHIDSKGYVYCASHAIRGRKLRGWEIHYLRTGRTLPSYTPGPEPVEVAPAAEVAAEVAPEPEPEAFTRADVTAAAAWAVDVAGTPGRVLRDGYRARQRPIMRGGYYATDHADAEAWLVAQWRAAGAPAAEAESVESFSYCKGHGWQVLAGDDVRAAARECSNCAVGVARVREVVAEVAHVPEVAEVARVREVVAEVAHVSEVVADYGNGRKHVRDEAGDVHYVTEVARARDVVAEVARARDVVAESPAPAGKVHYEIEWKGKTRVGCARPAARVTRNRAEVTCQRCIKSMPGGVATVRGPVAGEDPAGGREPAGDAPAGVGERGTVPGWANAPAVARAKLAGLTFRLELLSASAPNDDGTAGQWQLCADRDGELVSARTMTAAELAKVVVS